MSWLRWIPMLHFGRWQFHSPFLELLQKNSWLNPSLNHYPKEIYEIYSTRKIMIYTFKIQHNIDSRKHAQVRWFVMIFTYLGPNFLGRIKKSKLVGGFNPSEKYESQIGSSSPIWLGKIKFMFQTTNQKKTGWDYLMVFHQGTPHLQIACESTATPLQQLHGRGPVGANHDLNPWNPW